MTRVDSPACWASCARKSGETLVQGSYSYQLAATTLPHGQAHQLPAWLPPAAGAAGIAGRHSCRPAEQCCCSSIHPQRPALQVPCSSRGPGGEGVRPNRCRRPALLPGARGSRGCTAAPFCMLRAAQPRQVAAHELCMHPQGLALLPPCARQVESGSWEECAVQPGGPAASTAQPPAPEPSLPATLLAADGRPCVSPLFLHGQPAIGCVGIGDGTYCWLEEGGEEQASEARCYGSRPAGGHAHVGQHARKVHAGRHAASVARC